VIQMGPQHFEAGEGRQPGQADAGQCGGAHLSLRVGGEVVLTLTPTSPTWASKGIGALTVIARRTASMLDHWADREEDGEPRLKGNHDADSRTSP
jgi:hypothetical protein